MPRPSLLVLLGVFCTSALLGHAQQPEPAPPAPPAHVAFVDGAATLERDGEVDSVESGIPLVDGDRLETTSGRLELLFEDGSTVYVDEFSRLDVLSARFLRLVTGRLTFEVSNIGAVPASVLYELDTPAASVALSSPGEYRIVAQEDRFRGVGGAGAVEPTVTTVEVVRGTVTLTSDVGRTDLRAGEQSTVRNGEPPGFPVRFNSAQWTPFGHWVELRRSERREVSASRPYLPSDVQAYATEFDRNGTWGVEPEVGTVWYPTVGGGWRPYYNGRWSWIPRYGWTWVGHDAWSWPTHHYGRWGLNTRGSWYWIPGRQWSPAAVSWAVGSSFVSWCPLGFNGQPVVGFSNGPSYVYNRVFDPDFAWTTIPGHAFGTPVVAGRIAFAGRRWVDQHREPYVLQHYAPRGRGGNRFTSRRGGPEFTSRRPGPGQGPRGNRVGPEGQRLDVPGRNQAAVDPPTRYAVPRSSIGMPATSLPPAGQRPDVSRPRVMTPRGVFTPTPAPSPQIGIGSPFPPMPGPGALPQTRYGIPPALPPLMPSPAHNPPVADTSREAPSAASGDRSSSGRTAVPRSQSPSGSQSGSSSTQGRRSAGVSAPSSSGSGSGSVRTRSR
ncbi:MAG TPA: DUF6600 domain-containing protein [Vicinamibacterales bacterium]